MPWKVINRMDIKIQLVNDWNNGYFSVTDLSQKYEVSHPTIYKWFKRYNHLGIERLKNKAGLRRNALIELPKRFWNL